MAAGGFHHRVENSGERLDVFLSAKCGLSRTFVRQQIEAGRVCLNGEVTRKASRKLKPADEITGQFVETPSADLVPIHHPLEILFEDECLLVIDKPQGMVVHPAAGFRGETLVHHLLHHLASNAAFAEMTLPRPGIVHRLDRGTSGVMVVAKNRQTLDALAVQFKAREVTKEYRALAWGTSRPGGTVRSLIGRDLKNRKRMSSNTAQGRNAITRWEKIESFAHFSQLALYPQTGRTHQLRVHLSENKLPIVADTLYQGQVTPFRLRGLNGALHAPLLEFRHPCLHAYRLTLVHPHTKKTLTWEAPLPSGFQAFLNLLRECDAAKI